MYTQKIANIFDHIQDHSTLGLENKFGKQTRQLFDRCTLQILANKYGGVQTNLLYF